MNRDSKYYDYLKKLHSKGVPLERKHDTWKNWNEVDPSWNLDDTFDGAMSYRLANRQPDEPNPGTEEYIQYWQARFNAGDNVHMYGYFDCEVIPCDGLPLDPEEDEEIGDYEPQNCGSFILFFIKQPTFLHQEWKDKFDAEEPTWLTTKPDLTVGSLSIKEILSDGSLGDELVNDTATDGTNQPEGENINVEVGSKWQCIEEIYPYHLGDIAEVEAVKSEFVELTSGRFMYLPNFVDNFTKVTTHTDSSIQVGSRWIRKDDSLIGDREARELITVKSVGKYIKYNGDRLLEPHKFLELFLPLPDQSTDTSETTTTKEQIMPTNKIEITDNRTQPKTFQEMIEEIFGAQNATDLANKPEFVAHVFDESQSLSKIVAVDSNEAVIKMLQENPRYYLGFVITVYKQYDTHSLNIPVKSTRKPKKAK